MACPSGPIFAQIAAPETLDLFGLEFARPFAAETAQPGQPIIQWQARCGTPFKLKRLISLNVCPSRQDAAVGAEAEVVRHLNICDWISASDRQGVFASLLNVGGFGIECPIPTLAMRNYSWRSGPAASGRV